MFHKVSGIENFCIQERGRGKRCYQNFLSNNFVSLPKNFVAETSKVPLFSGNEKC